MRSLINESRGLSLVVGFFALPYGGRWAISEHGSLSLLYCTICPFLPRWCSNIPWQALEEQAGYTKIPRLHVIIFYWPNNHGLGSAARRHLEQSGGVPLLGVPGE
jgi:hypothetical protein